MIRIEPREKISNSSTVLIPIIAAVVSLLFAAIPLLAAGANPFVAYVETVSYTHLRAHETN